jgi:hypothetical protein
MTKTKTKTVAVYCRISKDRTGLEVGVERQRADCVELASRLWGEVPVRVGLRLTSPRRIHREMTQG